MHKATCMWISEAALNLPFLLDISVVSSFPPLQTVLWAVDGDRHSMQGHPLSSPQASSDLSCHRPAMREATPGFASTPAASFKQSHEGARPCPSVKAWGQVGFPLALLGRWGSAWGGVGPRHGALPSTAWWYWERGLETAENSLLTGAPTRIIQSFGLWHKRQMTWIDLCENGVVLKNRELASFH